MARSEARLDLPFDKERNSSVESLSDALDSCDSINISSDTLGTRIEKPREDLQKTSSLTASGPAGLGLDKYLPLGCVSFEAYLLDAAHLNSHQGEWVEFKENLPTRCTILSSVIGLWRAYWIRIFYTTSLNDPRRVVCRIYILPNDVACSSIDRKSRPLRKSLELLLPLLDVSPQTWSGTLAEPMCKFDPWANPEPGSLFFLFNTLPSPEPSLDAIRERHANDVARRILEPGCEIRGLKSQLYPYQKRTAAMMLQKETANKMVLDPRLEVRTSPTGAEFFYGPRDLLFMKQPRYYEAVSGGIVAETMGLGKTPICLALILSTKGFLPSVPPLYAKLEPPRRTTTAPLMEMAGSTAIRHGIPWRKVFDDIEEQSGDKLDSCIKMMESQVPKYDIPPPPLRSHRYSNIVGPSETVRLTGGTIVVVPRNLMHQWRSEISKHVDEGALTVLVMENPRIPIPEPEELARYDLILFSRPRFESENKNAHEWYVSPLKKLHWLRIIIDEGHSFSSTSCNAAIVAQKLVRAERRWVVSGTPAKDLLGVEVDMSSLTNEGDEQAVKDIRKQSLELRKNFNVFQEESSGAMKALGSLASHFLQAKPWAITSSDGADETASWVDYVFRHEQFRNRTFTSYSACFRRTLQDLVIKTQPEDVERDLQLPPLTHKVVRLQPSFHDKLTANLFVLVFTANAVTSERTDIDYLFHPHSQRHLHSLIKNLRQSAFFWTGLRQEHVIKSLETTRKYLEKENTKCTPEDRALLVEAAEGAELALNSPTWRAMTSSDEMGVFLSNWPHEDSHSLWAFDECEEPMMTGMTQSLHAQKHVNNHLAQEDPLASLKEVAIAAKHSMIEELTQSKSPVSEENNGMIKLGVPTTSISNDTMGSKRLSVSGVSRTTPKKPPTNKMSSISPISPKNAETPSPTKGKRRLSTSATDIELSSESPIGQTAIVGTSSSKLSYLIDRVASLHKDEKILIFFDGGHIAWYLSQALDLLHIKHLIYANTLSGEQKSKFIVLFDTDPTTRVLLMDIKQAAHGLNLASASRVFFVNPVCRPNVEAQAIKRAHRIGQTKDVHVETLVLQGTVEEAIHDRANAMTTHEHLNAKAYLEDDSTIAHIIQHARVLHVAPDEMIGTGQIAKLEFPQQLFGRPGRGKPNMSELEAELFSYEKPKTGRRSKKARLSERQDTSHQKEEAQEVPAIPALPFSLNLSTGQQATQSITPAWNHTSIFGGI